MPRFHFVSASIVCMLLLGASPVPASPIHFTAFLDGPSESPPNASPGIGTAMLVFDTDAHTLGIDVDFADLIGITTVAHIHCCVAPPGLAGPATPTPLLGFPLGVTVGDLDIVLDLSLSTSYAAGFLAANGGTAAGAEAALLAGLLAGEAYFNIHTSVFPGGEIRGFFARTTVPEPLTLGLLAGGLLLLGRHTRH